jgi:formylmethanofuran dehydrogenase subunit E
MVLRFSIFLLFLGSMSSCACDGEQIIRGMMWGMNKLAGEGYFPSNEILALGDFEGVEVNMTQNYHNGDSKAEVELSLINGKGHELQYNQENLARKCAILYAHGYSKIEDYNSVKIKFIQTDPFNPDNLAISEYSFGVEDLLQSQNPLDYGLQ